MTKDEVKAITTVPEVLRRYGIEVKRGRCKGICHEGKGLNVKISDSLYYCYVCGKGMDIFDLTMHLNHCDFRTAFELLGGTDKPSFRATVLADRAKKEREQRIVAENKKKAELRRITTLITAYRNVMIEENRMSELYAYCYAKCQYQIYLLEVYSRGGD